MPPPPTDESCLEKIDRISTTIKTSRNEISDILYSDINPEDKIIRSMEIQREAVHIAQLYKVKTNFTLMYNALQCFSHEQGSYSGYEIC